MIGADRQSACAGWSTALAVTLGSSLPVCAAEVKFDRSETVFPDAPLIRSDVFQGSPQGSETIGPSDPDLPSPFKRQGGDGGTGIRLAKYQLPRRSADAALPPSSSDGVRPRHGSQAPLP